MEQVNTFFYRKGNENHKLGTVSAVKRVEFVSDRMPYIILKSHLCDIIVLNVHTQAEVN
jgi:hypothetical protein